MENENTKILKELEANSDMSLIQGEKMVNAVDGLEPALEGILMKADELVRETKNKTPIMINIEGDVESIKGEKGDTPEVDYDGINLKIAEMHKESMEVMQKELTDTVREDILTVAEAIKPELLHEVEEKIGEFGEVLLVDIKNVGDKVIQAESQIDVTDSNLKELEKRVDGIKIPTYDLSPFAKADDVTKEVNDVKKTIDDKVAETAKSIETLKGEVEKKVSDLEDEQMQRLQKVASKTVSLVELDDVNLDGLTQTNGKYDLGSGGGGSGGCNVQTFTESGTWTKPDNAKTIEIYLLGAGAGGGSGAKGASGNRGGGSGGGPGSRIFLKFDASVAGATETVTVGQAGTGGVSQTSNSSAGFDGTAGGSTTFGSLFTAGGGSAGLKGTTTAGGTGGTDISGSTVYGLSGAGLAGANGGTGAAGQALAQGQNGNIGTCGGGGGAGVSSGGAAFSGSQGRGFTGPISIPGGAGGTSGASGSNGTSGLVNGVNIGSGGGGGASSVTTDAGSGGNAGLYGAGGGGGGASVDSIGNSGAGGNGSNGIALIVTYS